MNVTYKQKEMLLNILQEKPELIRGRLNRKSECRQKLNVIWDDVAAQLNTIEGPHKSGKEWAKTWQDIKGYILKKETKRRSYTEGTRGGPPTKIAFSNFEENILQLLTPEAAGLENIREGGIQDGIVNINNNIEHTNNLELNQNILETENVQISVPENEQNLETNHLEIIEQTENSENIMPNNYNQNTTSIRNARRGQSMQQMSSTMLDVQIEKLKLKKEELRLKKKSLKIKKKILRELKNIKTQLNT